MFLFWLVFGSSWCFVFPHGLFLILFLFQMGSGKDTFSCGRCIEKMARTWAFVWTSLGFVSLAFHFFALGPKEIFPSSRRVDHHSLNFNIAILKFFILTSYYTSHFPLFLSPLSFSKKLFLLQTPTGCLPPRGRQGPKPGTVPKRGNQPRRSDGR